MNNNNQANNNIYNEHPSTNISNSINTNTNSNVYNKEQVNTKNPVDNNYKYKSKSGVPKKTILFLSLSIINALTIVPLIILFCFSWLVFGLLSGSESLYYGVLIGCAIYVILSVIILLKEIFTALKYTSKNTNTFILMVIAPIIGLSIFNRIIIYCIPPSVKSRYSKIPQIVELKNNVLLETSDIEAKINEVTTTSDRLNINFKLNNKSNKYYNFDISKIRVNDYDTDFRKEIIDSNFAFVGNYWVEPNDSSDNYNVYIKYDELKKHNINYSNIKKLSFDLLLYYDDENGKIADSIQIPYNNFSVEVK